MNVFNSLGSNYNFQFILKSFFVRDYSSRLQTFLEKKYGGKVILFYKGRQAIEAALKISRLPKKSKVAINGFTCYAVYLAIKNAGFDPVYLDISKTDLNFSPQTLKNKLEETPGVKAVIIQNTLGYPCSIQKIKKICEESRLILIEDLAHCAGAIYSNGEVGKVGDFTVFSFSQDKMIDAVSGGALVIRNKKFTKNIPGQSNVNIAQQLKDRAYPLFTFLIRSTYSVGLGKIIHKSLRVLSLMSNPMGELVLGKLYKMPKWYSYLAYKELISLKNNLAHRRKIAKIYTENLNKKVLIESTIKYNERSSCLRFPILVENREFLIDYLKRRGIFVSDIWYDSPISPKKYLSLTDYMNDCPVAEEVSNLILNLPTHRNVSEKEAERIVKEINKWLS